MDASILAVHYLGKSLIALIVGIVLCFLASLGYNTYVKFHDRNKEKEIEVHTENSNSKNK